MSTFQKILKIHYTDLESPVAKEQKHNRKWVIGSNIVFLSETQLQNVQLSLCATAVQYSGGKQSINKRNQGSLDLYNSWKNQLLNDEI